MNKNNFWSNVALKMNQKFDLENFKTWEVVQQVPIYCHKDIGNYSASLHAPYSNEVSQLIKNKRGEERKKWIELLKEPFRGHTSQSYQEASLLLSGVHTSPILTSAWALKSAHHLLSFEDSSKRSLYSYDQIVEIGAGIGETGRILLDSGFKNPYHILDLPEIYRISSYYLSHYPNVSFHNRFSNIPNHTKTLVLGTWSFSEMPMEEREQILNHFRGADFHFLWQDRFFEHDNVTYFQRDLREKLKDYLWIEREIPHLNRDYYLTGLCGAKQ